MQLSLTRRAVMNRPVGDRKELQLDENRLVGIGAAFMFVTATVMFTGLQQLDGNSETTAPS